MGEEKRAQTTPDDVPLTQTHPLPEDNMSQSYNFDASSQTGNSASVTQPESIMENPLPQPTQIQTTVGSPQSIMENPLPESTQDSEAPLLLSPTKRPPPIIPPQMLPKKNYTRFGYPQYRPPGLLPKHALRGFTRN